MSFRDNIARAIYDADQKGVMEKYKTSWEDYCKGYSGKINMYHRRADAVMKVVLKESVRQHLGDID